MKLTKSDAAAVGRIAMFCALAASFAFGCEKARAMSELSWLDAHESMGCLHHRLEATEHLAAKSEADWTVKAFDKETGEDLRNFPPDRIVDYLHMRLEMRFEDLAQQRFEATETLRFVPIADDVHSLTLNAVGLEIQSSSVDGLEQSFYHDDDRVTVKFDPPIEDGVETELVFTYACEQPTRGMIFTPPSADAPQYAAEVHTQGQTEQNRNWFICHDSPNERLTTELIVDVPAEYSVSSNGRFVSQTQSGGRSVWHYLQDSPHVFYLVSLVIGEFEIVPIEHERVPMQVWVPAGTEQHVEGTYGRTGAMIDVFEERFGIPYPWARYDQLVVKNFGAGGMENTSVTSMHPAAIYDDVALEDRDMDGLIAHELAHQWTGDLITCKSWEHIWLNEGWATYGSALWFEHRDGEDGYLDSIRGNFNVAKRDKTKNDLPMVSPVYKNSWETFRRAANPYGKGSSIIHMLRMMLGEETFWKGVHIYMNRHANDVVETSDFRYALEEVSGRGLEWFFKQWCYRPGAPDLEVQVAFDAESNELTVQIEQKQQIDVRTPAFRFSLPIFVKTDASEETYAVEVTSKSTTFRRIIEGLPQIVAVDPYLHVLKTIHVDKPESMWFDQAKHGPTIAARHAAIEALGEKETPQARRLMRSVIENDDERWTLRETAVNALKEFGSDDSKSAVIELCETEFDDPRVRAPLVRAMKECDAEDVIELLSDVAEDDPSYEVRVAAIEGLRHHKADDEIDLFLKLVDVQSHHDKIRNAALESLAELDAEAALDPAIEYSKFGYMDRSRPSAINAIGKLAHHDPERCIPYLIDLLDDPERRAVEAAASALAKAGDERGIKPLKAMSETHPNERIRETAEAQLKALRKALKEDEKES